MSNATLDSVVQPHSSTEKCALILESWDTYAILKNEHIMFGKCRARRKFTAESDVNSLLKSHLLSCAFEEVLERLSVLPNRAPVRGWRLDTLEL
jgi:hypothetical protein